MHLILWVSNPLLLTFTTFICVNQGLKLPGSCISTVNSDVPPLNLSYGKARLKKGLSAMTDGNSVYSNFIRPSQRWCDEPVLTKKGESLKYGDRRHTVSLTWKTLVILVGTTSPRSSRRDCYLIPFGTSHCLCSTHSVRVILIAQP